MSQPERERRPRFIDQPTRITLGVAGGALESAVIYLMLNPFSICPPAPPPPPPPGKEIVYRAVCMAGSAGTLTVRLVNSIPAYAPVSGDLLVAAISWRGGGSITITPPTGWTLVRRDDQGGDVGCAIYVHAYSPGEAMYTWSFSSSAVTVAVMAIWSNVDLTRPVEAQGGRAYPATTLVTAPSLTTTVPNTVLFAVFAMNVFTGFTVPSGMAHVGGSNYSPPSGLSMDTDRQLFSDVGSTGERTANSTTGAIAPAIGQMIALRPAPA